MKHVVVWALVAALIVGFCPKVDADPAVVSISCTISVAATCSDIGPLNGQSTCNFSVSGTLSQIDLQSAPIYPASAYTDAWGMANSAPTVAITNVTATGGYTVVLQSARVLHLARHAGWTGTATIVGSCSGAVARAPAPIPTPIACPTAGANVTITGTSMPACSFSATAGTGTLTGITAGANIVVSPATAPTPTVAVTAAPNFVGAVKTQDVVYATSDNTIAPTWCHNLGVGSICSTTAAGIGQFFGGDNNGSCEWVGNANTVQWGSSLCSITQNTNGASRATCAVTSPATTCTITVTVTHMAGRVCVASWDSAATTVAQTAWLPVGVDDSGLGSATLVIHMAESVATTGTLGAAYHCF